METTPQTRLDLNPDHAARASHYLSALTVALARLDDGHPSLPAVCRHADRLGFELAQLLPPEARQAFTDGLNWRLNK
jgi:hypothetical protein